MRRLRQDYGAAGAGRGDGRIDAQRSTLNAQREDTDGGGAIEEVTRWATAPYHTTSRRTGNQQGDGHFPYFLPGFSRMIAEGRDGWPATISMRAE